MRPTPIRLLETSPPGAEPVTLAEAKAQLRIDGDFENATVAGLIAAARQACESFTGRALITRGLALYLDAWPEDDRVAVELPRPPLVEVTRINVYADNDTALEFPAADYFVDAVSAPGRVALRVCVTPPLPLRTVNGIEILYRAGYGHAPDTVPAALRQGIRQMVAHLYQHRGDDANMALAASGALALFQPYRIMQL